MSAEPAEGDPRPAVATERAVHEDLPSTLRAPRQARVTVRNVLNAWGLGSLSNDAELLTSELVANAAQHTSGSPIGLTIRQHTAPTGQRGILCQVTDPDPALPEVPSAELDSEHGRGLALVAAMSTSSGFTTNSRGKTAWFTLTAERDRIRSRSLDRGAEASA